MTRIFTKACALAAITFSCPAQEPGGDDGTTATALQQRVDGANEFACALHRELGEGNLFFSPYSISAAFAMCWAACEGDSHRDIGKVLKLAQRPEVVHDATARLQRMLETKDTNAPYLLRVANRLWGHAGAPDGYYQESFLAAMNKRYGAALELVDFGKPEAARARINGWVSEKTLTRIPDLIPKGEIDASTVFVITNAVYFKGSWADRFDEKFTKPAPFHVTADSTVTVPLMQRTGTYQVGSIPLAEVVALPYAGDHLRMLVFLPKAGKLAELQSALSPKLLAATRKSLTERQVRLALPKFRLETSYRLHQDGLPQLGMRAPFRFSNDWRPLNGGAEPLGISGVFHDAFVEVSEKGTEAAAATAIVMKRGGRPPSFRADRPFLFAIEDVRTGLLLFLGRVVDPKAGAD